MGRSSSVATRSIARKTVFAVLALAIAVIGIFAMAPVASAQTTVGGEGCFTDPYGERVCPNDEVRDPRTAVEAELLERPGTTPDSPSSDSTLPFTGADVTLFLVTGAALVATGSLLVRRTRTRRSEV
jgi:hypothetical protein